MLNNISSLITPDIYKVMYSMGHLDELAIVDANFSEQHLSKQNSLFVPLSYTNKLLTEILHFFPIDDDEIDPVCVFIPDFSDSEEPPSWNEYQEIIDSYCGIGKIVIKKIDRKAFFAKTESSYASIKTIDQRAYSNIIIRKGFVLNLEDSLKIGNV